MPQGMCNSAATFQRLMNLVLAGLNYEICLVYIDDIIIFSKDLNEHLDRLEVVLQKLEEAGLKIRPDKCKMLQREVHFLGHVISGDGIRTSPSKTEVVATWPVPTKVTELRSFIGLCSYYRRFIKDFAKTAKPLHALTGKYAEIPLDTRLPSRIRRVEAENDHSASCRFPSRRRYLHIRL